MGAAILRNSAAAATIDKLSNVLRTDVRALLTTAPMDILKKTRSTQPAIFAVQAAYAAAVNQRLPGLRIAGTGGNSLGAYMALVISRAMSLEDAASLLVARAEAMGRACERTASTLRAFKANRAFTEDLISRAGDLWVALVNAPGQVIVGGTLASFENLDRILTAEGYDPLDESNEFKMKQLEVDGAFHTPLMQSDIEVFERALATADIRVPEIPFFSDTSGRREEDPNRIRQLLLEQITMTVEWDMCVRSMGNECPQFLEASNRCVVGGMVELIDLDFDVEMISTLEEIENLA